MGSLALFEDMQRSLGVDVNCDSFVLPVVNRTFA